MHGTAFVLCWTGRPIFPVVLKGSELIDFVKVNEDLAVPELVRSAGYIRLTKAGKEQLLHKQFTNALLAARGVNLKNPKAAGKLPTFETSVHESGIVLVGKTYTDRFGLTPGDVLSIEFGESEIRLVPQPGKKAAPKGKKAAACVAPVATEEDEDSDVEELLELEAAAA